MSVMIKLKNLDDGQQVSALNGEEDPDITGFGGWETKDRPKDSPVTVWRGSPSVRMVLDLVFDGFSSGESVRSDCNQLQSWAWPTSSKSTRTARIQATGELIPLGAGRVWVIDDLNWGEGIADGSLLLRRQVTVSLLEYQAPDLAKVKTVSSSYKTQKGDTLRKIASKLLGSSKRWTEIRDLNPKLKLRDPSRRLKPGKIIKMPFL